MERRIALKLNRIIMGRVEIFKTGGNASLWSGLLNDSWAFDNFQKRTTKYSRIFSISYSFQPILKAANLVKNHSSK